MCAVEAHTDTSNDQESTSQHTLCSAGEKYQITVISESVGEASVTVNKQQQPHH